MDDRRYRKEKSRKGIRNDFGCRVGHAGVVVTVVDAVPHVQRQVRLVLREDAGGDLVAEDGIVLFAHNVDSEYISRRENNT